jgi:hypothetical protein
MLRCWHYPQSGVPENGSVMDWLAQRVAFSTHLIEQLARAQNWMKQMADRGRVAREF